MKTVDYTVTTQDFADPVVQARNLWQFFARVHTCSYRVKVLQLISSKRFDCTHEFEPLPLEVV